MQGKNQLLHNLYDHIKAFQNILSLWKIQVQNTDFTDFLALSQSKVTTTDKYCTALLFPNLSSAQGSKTSNQVKNC
jgi:hypothetical protein